MDEVSINRDLTQDYLGTIKTLSQLVKEQKLEADEYKSIVSKFVSSWAKANLNLDLDNEQSFAVGEQGGDIRVTARAGSGKTRTLVTRAIFLVKHCKIDPKSMMLLAFNRKAAEEMLERLKDVLGNDLPHAMTFHALAYSIVHPDDEIMIDAPSNQTLTRFIQEVIDSKHEDPNSHIQIRNFMLEYFRDEWDNYVQGGYYLKIDDFLNTKRNLPTETLNGEFVKSYGERLIANTLFEYGVEYKYEKNFFWNGSNYRPDFTIELPQGGVVIEYFGMSGNVDYDENSSDKRRFWQTQQGWKLVERKQSDINQNGNDTFRSNLIEELDRLGVKTSKLSEEEIWEKIRKRAIGNFDRLSKQFIGMARKKQMTALDLDASIKSHKADTKAEKQFLHLQSSIYREYLLKLTERGVDDFDGILQKAINGMQEGRTNFSRKKGGQFGNIENLRYVFVDEFQDMSPLFYSLLLGIRANSELAEFFCVGDNWQAINSFAGSDLTYFNHFGEYFRNHKSLEILTNYRSPQSVVELGNGIMDDRGEPSVAHRSDKGSVQFLDLKRSAISSLEADNHKGDLITPVLIRIASASLSRGQNVVILCRRNSIPYYVQYRPEDKQKSDGLEKYLEHVRRYLPEGDQERITISTAHGYKGLENDSVVIIDVMEGSYPLIHQFWRYLRVFGTDIENVISEERRLFYVAATRATESVVLITNSDQKSQFIGELEKVLDIKQVELSAFPPVDRIDSNQVLIRVFNCFAVKDELKREGFKWDPTSKAWFRRVASQSFRPDEYMKRPWNTGEVSIKVFASDMSIIWKSGINT